MQMQTWVDRVNLATAAKKEPEHWSEVMKPMIQAYTAISKFATSSLTLKRGEFAKLIQFDHLDHDSDKKWSYCVFSLSKAIDISQPFVRPQTKKEAREGVTPESVDLVDLFNKKFSEYGRTEILPNPHHEGSGILYMTFGVPKKYLHLVMDEVNDVNLYKAWIGWLVEDNFVVPKAKKAKPEFKQPKLIKLINGEIRWVPFIDRRDELDEELGVALAEGRKGRNLGPRNAVSFVDFEEMVIYYRNSLGAPLIDPMTGATENISPRDILRILERTPSDYEWLRNHPTFSMLYPAKKFYDYATDAAFAQRIDEEREALERTLYANIRAPLALMAQIGIMEIVIKEAEKYLEHRENLEAEVERLNALAPDDAPELSNLEGVPNGGTLLPHQGLALARAKDLTAMAYDIDMGGGKTLTYVADIIAQFHKGSASKALIVMPNHLLVQQFNEIYEFTEKTMNIVLLNTATTRTMGYDELIDFCQKAPKYTIFLTSYDWLIGDREHIGSQSGRYVYNFPRSNDMLQKAGVDMVILDESHYIKNADSVRSQACLALSSAPIRRIGSGTITPNTPGDIVTQFSFLDPSIFGTHTDFDKEYVSRKSASGKAIGFLDGALKEIRKKVMESGSISIRRSAWLHLLPRRHYNTHYVKLSSAQQKIYREKVLQSVLDEIKNDPKLADLWGKFQESDDYEAMDFTPLLAKFSSIDIYLCAPDHIGKFAEFLPPEERVSPKVEKIRELLGQHFAATNIDRGKVVVFAKYKESAKHIYRHVPKSYGPLYYDGSGGWGDNLELFKENPDYRVLVACDASLKVGHNLQVANRLIRADVHWSPGDQEQTYGRVFRFGQTHDVYIDLVLADGTAEITKYGRLLAKYHQIMKANSDFDDEVELPVVTMNMDAMENFTESWMITPYEERREQIDEYEWKENENWVDKFPLSDVRPYKRTKPLDIELLDTVPWVTGMPEELGEKRKSTKQREMETSDDATPESIEMFYVKMGKEHTLVVPGEKHPILTSLKFQKRDPYWYYTNPSKSKVTAMLRELDNRFGVANKTEVTRAIDEYKKRKTKKKTEGYLFEVEGASKWSKGDRIVIEYDPNEYYIGTVTAVRGNKVHVLFDDGDKESYSTRSKKIVGPGVDKKRKTRIPKNKLDSYLAKEGEDEDEDAYKDTPRTKKQRKEQEKAKGWSKGDRIVINYEGDTKNPEYYIGTVTAVRGNKVYVLFDDGDKQTYDIKSESIVGLGVDKKRKSEIPEDKLDRYLAEDVKKVKKVKKTKEPEDLGVDEEETGIHVIFTSIDGEPGLIVPETDDPKMNKELKKLRGMRFQRQRTSFVRSFASKSTIKTAIAKIDKAGVIISNRDGLRADLLQFLKIDIGA